MGKMEKTTQILTKIMAMIGMIIMAVLLLYSFRYTKRLLYSEAILDEGDSIGWNLAAVVLAFVVIFFLGKLAQKISERKLLIAACIVSLAVAGYACFLAVSADIYAVGDQYQLYHAANSLITGDVEWMKEYPYFRKFPFQFAIIELYTLIFKITGSTDYDVLCGAQAIATGCVVLGGFLTTREVFREKRAQLIYLVCSVLFFPIYHYALYIYGEAFGTCFLVWSVYFFLRANRDGATKRTYFISMVCSILFMTFAYMMRRGFLVAVVAMAIWQLLLSMKKKNFWPLLGLIVMYLVMLLGQFLSVKLAEKLVDAEYSTACPTVMWVAMGMMDSTEGSFLAPGSYNGYNDEVFEVVCDYDADAASKIAWQDIRERTAYFACYPAEAFQFYKEKMASEWNEPTYGAFAMTYFMAEPDDWAYTLYMGVEESAFVRAYLNRYQVVLYTALFAGFLLIFLKEWDLRRIFPLLLFLGGFFLSLIWESKSRYIYPYMVLALPAIAASLDITSRAAWQKLFQIGLTVKRRFQK